MKDETKQKIEQLKRIRKVIVLAKDGKISIKEIPIKINKNFISKNKQDIKVFNELLEELIKKKKEKNNFIKSLSTIEPKDPYIILGIKKSNYTRYELLEIVEKRIKELQTSWYEKKLIDKEIDEVLDAYNQLIYKK